MVSFSPSRPRFSGDRRILPGISLGEAFVDGVAIPLGDGLLTEPLDDSLAPFLHRPYQLFY